MANGINEQREGAFQRYVDILTNGGFKALFGDIANKEVVKSIINVLLPEHRKVTEIEYLPTEYQGQVVDLNKEYHYDFMCKDQSGTVFIVELQRYQEDYWFKRCVSYACRAYDRQNRKGEAYITTCLAKQLLLYLQRWQTSASVRKSA